MIGVAAAPAGGIEVGLVRASIGVPVVQHGVETGQARAGAEEQRQQEERPDTRHLYAASLTLGAGTAAPAPVTRRRPYAARRRSPNMQTTIGPVGRS